MTTDYIDPRFEHVPDVSSFMIRRLKAEAKRLGDTAFLDQVGQIAAWSEWEKAANR